MIRQVVFCNKCGKKCEGTTYYTVEIYGHDINPSNDGGTSMDTARQNISEETKKTSGTQRHYCKECKEKIEMFSEGGE